MYKADFEPDETPPSKKLSHLNVEDFIAGGSAEVATKVIIEVSGSRSTVEKKKNK